MSNPEILIAGSTKGGPYLVLTSSAVEPRQKMGASGLLIALVAFWGAKEMRSISFEVELLQCLRKHPHGDLEETHIVEQ